MNSANAFLKQGAEAFAAGDTKSGLKNWEAALSSLSGAVHSARRLELLRRLAFAYRKAGNAGRARALLESQCKEAAELEDTEELAKGRYALGLLLVDRGDEAAAEKSWMMAVDVSREGNIFTVLSDALACIASLRSKVGSHDEAESFLEDARRAAERGESMGQLADVLDDLARLHRSTGRDVLAASYAKRAIDAYRQARDEAGAERVAREFLS